MTSQMYHLDSETTLKIENQSIILSLTTYHVHTL